MIPPVPFDGGNIPTLLPAGSTIRAPRASDAEAVTELLRACDVVIFGEPDTDVMDVRDDWASPGFDLDRDAWMLEGTDGALRAYAFVHARGEGDYDGLLYVRPGDSIPELAPVLLELMEKRTLEKTHGASVDLCFFTASVEVEMREMLERAGYAEARTFFRMRIDLSPASKESDGSPSGDWYFISKKSPRENPSLSRVAGVRSMRMRKNVRAST